MPVELGLELVAIVSSDFTNAEWELVDDVINEVDRVGLGVFLVDLECADTASIVNGSILEPADFLSLLPMKVRNLTSIWMWCPGDVMSWTAPAPS